VLFDAFLHGAGLAPRDVADLRYFGVDGALCVLAGDGPPAAPALRRGWAELAERAVPLLRRRGLGAFAALSVPPARIPARGREALLAELPEWLSRRGVAAIGPVGPGAGTPREEEVLARQLEMARELRRPVLLVVRGRDAARLGRRALAAIRESGLPPERVLLDGTGSGGVRTVRALGCVTVLSLSAGRGGVEAAVRVVRELGPEGIALASHAGEGMGDLLALPRAADRLGRAGLSDAVIRRVCGRNALSALGIAGSEVRSAVAPIARSDHRPSR
jgi:hypothetical protein